ncbi:MULTISPECIES: C40 family peptidase [Lactobacillaceae]|uniref:C40 family peptidase n=1 Tax=Lactobacillaceae TaxID=33958 RepID=UPI001CD8C7A0|nr:MULTISPECIES: C40 family peptidase [Lactobacillaceae]
MKFTKGNIKWYSALFSCSVFLIGSISIVNADESSNSNNQMQQSVVSVSAKTNNGQNNNLIKKDEDNQTSDQQINIQVTPSSNLQSVNLVQSQAATNGVVNENGNNYYYQNGQRQTNYFLNQNNKVYYFDNNGVMYQNKWYYNWGNSYYFGSDGARYTNQFLNQNGKVYYFGDGGVMYQNKWYYNWGNSYYFGSDGARYTNQFLNQNGKVYYFGDGGVMYQNKWYYNWGHSYYFKSDGARATNETLTIDGISYYFDNEGIAHSNKASQVVSIAKQQLGKPYIWGATGPNAFDCSGLVQYVYRQVGISLPRTTYQQEYQGKAVSLNSLQLGDLLFWGNYGSAYHVAIYIGDGNFIQAPTKGQSVKVTNIKYYQPTFARRIL